MSLALGSPPFPGAGEILAGLSALLWASTQIVLARLGRRLSAGALNWGKNLTGAACFLALMALVTGTVWPSALPGGALWAYLAAGVIGLSLCDLYLLRCMKALGPQRMTLILCLAPVLVAVGALAPPFGERPPLGAWLGMAVCITGIVLAIRERPAPDQPRTIRGRALADGLVAAVLQAVAILCARHAGTLAPDTALEGAALRMYAGVVGLVAIGLPFGHLLTWQREIRPPRTFAILAAGAFFGTFLGILCNQAGLAWAEHTGVASVLNSLMPVYLIPLGLVFLDQRVTAWGWVATLVAVAGVGLMAVA